MMIFFKVLIVVYFLAINVYSFNLLRTQKNASNEGDCDNVRDGSLFITAMLGGAIAIYVAMFIFRYRLRNLFLMVTMPILIAVNIYIFFIALTTGFGFGFI